MVLTPPLSLSEAVSTKSPSLVRIKNEYGETTLIAVVRFMLLEVAVFTGIREKFTDAQMNSLANTLLFQKPDITITELKYFFELFKQGKYLVFQGYERPNLQVITKSFEMFKTDLREEREHIHSIKNADMIIEQNALDRQSSVLMPSGQTTLEECLKAVRLRTPKPMTPEREERIRQNKLKVEEFKKQHNL